MIYTMRASNLKAEEAAEYFELPLEQVLEARAYIQAHGDLITSEMA